MAWLISCLVLMVRMGQMAHSSQNIKITCLPLHSGYNGYIPMLDGHIWDSLFRVLVALAIGILLGVPLGIYMGVSRFFVFFDPLIELYRQYRHWHGRH